MPARDFALQQVAEHAQRDRQRDQRLAHPRPTRRRTAFAGVNRRFRRPREQPPDRQPRELSNRPANRQPRNDHAHEPADDADSAA